MIRRSVVPIVTSDFRPDVEGLRAVAVVAVVLFHARLSAFTGGFVGVDVFFVLSGFLITRLLLRELATSGTISLPAFWARRARRLLPASCVVIVVTLIVAHWMLPPLGLHDLAIDALAAGVFSVNFVFAHRLGDYFGSQLGQTSPSPLLHFWSLAVEEQFYLFWPALMLVLTRRPRQYARLLSTTIVVLGTASFVSSVWLTNHHPTWAFYLLPARMGELLCGAMVAVGASRFPAISANGRAVAAWIGVLGIAVAVVRYDSATLFPGTATILPVFSTALILIAGGDGRSRFGPAVVLEIAPLQWIGRHSYAIYLWHWPALVLADAKFGPLSLVQRFVVIAISVVLAAISLRLVEDPVRHSERLAAIPRRGLMLGAGLCALALVSGALALNLVPGLSTNSLAAAPVLGVNDPSASITVIPGSPAVSTPPIVNDGSLASLIALNQTVLAQGLATTNVPANLKPPLADVLADRPAIYADGCVAEGVDDVVNACHYGKKGATTRVILFGDSHAAQWFPPLEQIATAHGFELIVLTKGGCPFGDVKIPTATLTRTCPVWRDKALQVIQLDKPDLVIVADSWHYTNSDAEWTAGFDTSMTRLNAVARKVLVLGDNPGSKTDPAGCLSSNVQNVHACTTTRAHAVLSGRLAGVKSVAAAHGSTFVDTSDWLCTATACPVILGDIMIFRDQTHLTTFASTYLRPLLEAAVMPVLSASG